MESKKEILWWVAICLASVSAVLNIVRGYHGRPGKVEAELVGPIRYFADNTVDWKYFVAHASNVVHGRLQ